MSLNDLPILVVLIFDYCSFVFLQVGVNRTPSRRSRHHGPSLLLLHPLLWIMGHLPGESPWTIAPPGMNPTEIPVLDGATSTNLVGVHMKVTVKHISREVVYFV